MRQIIPLIFVLAAFTGSPFTTNAQISIESRPIKVLTACFNEAINANRITKQGTVIIFKCAGDTAQAFYQTLVNHETHDRAMSQGYRARLRYIYDGKTHNACYNLYENNRGESINKFLCEMTYDAGEFINE